MNTTYLIHESPGVEIFAEVEYEIIPASGDGWHEPLERAHVDFSITRLIQNRQRLAFAKCESVWETVDLGPAPAWVKDILAADEDWQSDLLSDHEDDGQPDERQEWRDFDPAC